MSSHFKVQLKAVATASADGTVAFPRFKQEQLVKLYNCISDQRDALQEALLSDVGLTRSEAEVELAETLSLVKRLVNASDFELQTDKSKKELRQEGKFQHGKGLIVVCAWCSRLLHESTSKVSHLLQTSLASSLNRFAYLFTSAITLAELLGSNSLPPSSTLVVSGSPSSASVHPTIINQAGASGPNVLIDRFLPSSPPQLVAHYARLITRAAFHAQGRLPGSVHRVLVHQESADQLLAALRDEVRSSFGAAGEKGARRDTIPRSEKEHVKHLLSSVLEKGQGQILVGGGEKCLSSDSFSPTIITEPTLDLFRKDLRGPILLVQTFASHEDAFHLLNQIDSSVLHVFSGEQAALEYLATESKALTVYGNDIPISALYDPHRALTDSTSYSTSCKLHLTALSDRLSTSPLTRLALATLPKSLAYNRTKFSNSILRVFFLQGVFLSLGSVATVLLSSLGFGGWLAVDWIRRTYFA